MLGSDLIICQWNDTSGKTRCSDHLGPSVYPSRVPNEDAQQNIWTLSGYKADNRIEITFKRLLNTGDSLNDFIVTRGSVLNLVWAFGYPDRLYHGTKNRGS